ncbi:plasmid mobilization protein [Vibrio sp. LaRot3]|uniref:plasmid mobilization protein n=1 Tax=Vibrio sp. LaRot3 TaxID=2998829 RepID=UPI0022CE3623|nr:hypothetical protein [Vibrio sp. LaRot3]MDA0148169.1 hypothetical protein [Vibrio sp. LaRot3]
MMDLPSIEEVERSVGGRPKLEERKVRVSFYIKPVEAEVLRQKALERDMSISEYVRKMIVV